MTTESQELAADLPRMSGLEALRAMASRADGLANMGRLIGMRAEEIEFGKVVFGVRTRPDFANPLGSLHGGICATLLDSAMACAVHSTLDPGVAYGTLELKVNYLRSVHVDGRRLLGTGTTVHVGRTTATAEGRVLDDESGKLVAHGTTTCILHR